jgi:hypothetical protein
MYDGVMKISRYGQPSICKLRYDNPLTPLVKCVFTTKNYNPTNLETHLCGRHKQVECPEVYKTKEARFKSMINEETSKVSAAGSISSFMTKNTTENALKEVHICMYQFFNKASV